MISPSHEHLEISKASYNYFNPANIHIDYWTHQTFRHRRSDRETRADAMMYALTFSSGQGTPSLVPEDGVCVLGGTWSDE